MGMGGATGTGRGASLADIVADAVQLCGLKMHVSKFQYSAGNKKNAYEIELPNGVLYVDGMPGRVRSSWIDQLPAGITLVHAAYTSQDFYNDCAASEAMVKLLKEKDIFGKRVYGDNWTSVSKDIVFPFVEARVSKKAELPFTIDAFIKVSEHIRIARDNYLSDLNQF